MQARPAPSAAQQSRNTLVIYVALAAAILVVHWGALFDETRHDDHLHRENLRTKGWSGRDLIESTTFELPGRQMHFWWQTQPVQWRFPRPVAMAVLKAEFSIASGEPLALHVFGLAWHLLNCVLVFQLARWTLQSTPWAVLAAVLFVVGPSSAVAVSWTAAHNALVSNALLLAGVLLYVRSGFDRLAAPIVVRVAPLCGAIACWTAALLSREAAIIFPILAIGLDLCFGGGSVLRRRWWIHALLIAFALAYVVWRFFVFPTGGMPAGYMHTPTGIQYTWWALNKWVQAIAILLAQLPLYAPLDYIEHWTPLLIVVHLGLLAITAAVGIAVARVMRGERGRWFGPLWFAVALLPVVPIATSPHFAYSPFVGYALGTAAFLRRFPQRWRTTNIVITIAFLAGMFALQRFLVRMQLRTEQLVIADVLETSPSPRPAAGSTLIFVDLPASATFSVFALREVWGLSDLTGYVLTTLDYVHRARGPTRIERIGDRTLELSCDPPGWFSQPFDRWSMKLLGRGEPFTPETLAKTALFDATVVNADPHGVTRIRFDFCDTLDRPDWLFYAAAPDRPMHRLRFGAAVAAAEEAHDTTAFQARHADWFAERNPLLAFRRWLESSREAP